MHLIEVWEDNVLKYRIQINSKRNSFWSVSLELQYIQIPEHKVIKIKHSFFLTKTGFKFVEWNTKFSEHSVHIQSI